uniref:Uncharacterized protein n=1 Tax=candidate division WOR-3 bacterium TaxID=2052148 RepID=A0A7C4GEH1_UNCW3
MALLQKLAKAESVKMLCGMRVAFGTGTTNPRRVSVEVVPGAREPGPDDQVLLGLHYYATVLSRYPKDSSVTYKFASDLRWMVDKIVEEGLWPGSDLRKYAGVADELELAGPGEPSGQTVEAAVIRPLLGDDLELAMEIPRELPETDLMLSVVAVLQTILGRLDDAGAELFDRALRILRRSLDEGADYAAPGAARNLANRALREAGGTAA